VFYINLPIGILDAVLGISAFMPRDRRDRSDVPKFDWFGFGMLSLGIGALQMMLDRGENLGWFGSTEIIVEAVLSGRRLLFLPRCWRRAAPAPCSPC
jgi:MFS transporter, DHA2 family, multidrug resistance protein